MPLPPLAPPELRLGRFARLCSALYGAAGLFFLFAPELSFRLATLGTPSIWSPAARFWQVLSVALMASISVACALAAGAPRERRLLLLPVLAGKLTSSVLGLVFFASLHESAPLEARGALGVLLTDLPLFLLTLFFYRAASTGVDLGAPTQAPPAREAASQAAPVKLGVGSQPKT